MKTILAEDAEKYSELVCEVRLKNDAIRIVDGMIKCPDTREVVALAFADKSKNAHGGFCYGPHVNIEDFQEQSECLEFFASILKKQLDKLNQQIEELEGKNKNE